MGLRDTPPDKLNPGEISVLPLTGHIPALEHQMITVNYLPGVPMKFENKFEIQVAHFEPEEIRLKGEAVFPRVSFNVPQSVDIVDTDIQDEARKSLGLSKEEPDRTGYGDGETLVPISGGQRNLWLTTNKFQSEMERLLVKKFAQDNSERLFGVLKRSSKLRCVS